MRQSRSKILPPLAALALFACASAGLAQEHATRTVFSNVHVFDGEAEKRIMNANVLVEGNLIKQVSSKPIPADGATVIDGGGRTLMPGLIEPHSHPVISALLYDGIDVSGFRNASGAEVMEKLRELWDQAPVREDLDGQQVKLPGFIVPVEADGSFHVDLPADLPVRDFSGKLLVPGFIDCHVHFLPGGFRLASVQLRDAATPEEFTQRIKDFASTIAPGVWITGMLRAVQALTSTLTGFPRQTATTRRSGSCRSTMAISASVAPQRWLTSGILRIVSVACCPG
mgnify:CR=1 FL=1